MGESFVIGINGSLHDSAVAALSLERQEPVLVLSEDRHSGIPHHVGFPWWSLQHAIARVGRERVAAVAYTVDKEAFRSPPEEYFRDLLTPPQEFLARAELAAICTRLEASHPRVEWLPVVINGLLAQLDVPSGDLIHLRKRFNYILSKFLTQLFVEAQIRRVLPGVPMLGLRHHDAHAATYYASPHQRAAIITWDGRGEFDTTVLWAGAGRTITRLATVRHPRSLGSFYEIFSEYLGFNRVSGPGKTMGLAAYGDDRFVPLFRDMVRVAPGAFDFTYDPRHLTCTQSERLTVTPGLRAIIGPPRQPGEPLEARHQAIAHGVQKGLEAAALALVAHARQRVGSDNLVLSGGVALNCVLNAVIHARTGITPFLLPPCSDDGIALGAAILLKRRLLDGIPLAGAIPSAGPSPTVREPPAEEAGAVAAAAGAAPLIRYRGSYGTSHSGEEVERLLLREGLRHQRAGEERVAALLAAGKVLGVLRGPYEFGPRALGQRSILADPRVAGNWPGINQRVKFREDFRPFAPMMLWEEAQALWEAGGVPIPSPHMLLAPRLRPRARAWIPAVVHVDLTSRLQTVHAGENPELHRLLSAFKGHSGIGCLLNTSLNMAGESIIADPAELLEFLACSALDGVWMAGWLVLREGNEAPLAALAARFPTREAYLQRRPRRYREFLQRNGYPQHTPHTFFPLFSRLFGVSPGGPAGHEGGTWFPMGETAGGR